MLRDLRQGSDLHPEEGATLVLAATLGEGQALRLTGPGVDGLVDVKIGGLPDGFWDMRRDVMRYPMGFEIFLIDGARVLGLPRSTAVEVL
jgi:alpha-D-ribose 1-methylphosphonate 5-triphosphate synthase subunit PhnH